MTSIKKFSIISREELESLKKDREELYRSKEILPRGYCWQIAHESFDFDVILRLPIYTKRWDEAISLDLIRDITDGKYSDMTADNNVPELEYIHIVQKSALWLELRAKAQGTASSVGKYLSSGERFPTQTQIEEQWGAKLRGDPFVKTITTAGHMEWGVKYEDAALMTFAMEKKMCVTQVGTIKVPMIYIHSLARDYIEDFASSLQFQCEHLLISPDGVVGDPEPCNNSVLPRGMKTEISSKLRGMLEIKCISPFHHLPGDDGKLLWCADMDKRQWHRVLDIPYVYIIQMALQAISGKFFYQMKDDDVMWFIRWAPKGYSLFSFPFRNLIKMGILASHLYFSILKRVTEQHQIYPYTSEETQINAQLRKEYLRISEIATYEYHDLDGYEEFYHYRELTKHYHFSMPDVSGTSTPKDDSSDIPEKLQRGVCLL